MTFQRTKTWKESEDPAFDANLDRIEYAINQRPDRTFAFDEFGPLGIRPTAGSCWAAEGKPDQLPATFHRTHGVTYFHGCYSVGDDPLWGVNRRRKGAVPSLAAQRRERARVRSEKGIRWGGRPLSVSTLLTGSEDYPA
nr:hypothetical protein [Actinomadura verrucosospora]